MDRKEGTIRIRTLAAGSKSDGNYAYLTCGDPVAEYHLYRRETYPVDDPYLMQFDGCEVAVEGTVQEGGWIEVDNITPLNDCRTGDDDPGNSIAEQ